MRSCSYTELEQFFGAYFHQDYDIVADTSDGVVDFYIGDVPDREHLAHLAALIDALIAEFSDDQALEQVLFEDLCCDYDPRLGPDGQSVRSWLRGISDKLRAASERLP